jgi:hypothetical protein
MMSARLEQEFVDELERLDPRERARMLRNLVPTQPVRPPGTPGKEPPRFAGAISEEALTEMERVIDGEFEQDR